MKVLFAIGDLPEHLEHSLAREGFKEDRYVNWTSDQLPHVGQSLSGDLVHQVYGPELSAYSLNVIDRLERDGGVPVVVLGVRE